MMKCSPFHFSSIPVFFFVIRQQTWRKFVLLVYILGGILRVRNNYKKSVKLFVTDSFEQQSIINRSFVNTVNSTRNCKPRHARQHHNKNSCFVLFFS